MRPTPNAFSQKTVLLLALLLIFILNLTFSQAQETPTETPVDTPTEAVVETPTDLPTDTPTDLPTETATETATSAPTDTPTEAVVTETATAEPATLSPSETPSEATAEVAPEVTEETTAESTPVIVEEATATLEGDAPTPLPPATETATASPTLEPVPPEPPLNPIFVETFDGGPSMLWTLGAGWSYVPNGSGLALQGTVNGEPVTFANSDVRDAAVEIQFRLGTGAIQLSTRVSEAGRYTASVRADGQVQLLRNDAVLRNVTLPPLTPDTWHALRLTALGDAVWLAVDGVPVTFIRDPQPLPAGAVTLAGQGIDIAPLLVDDFGLSIVSEVGSGPTETPLATPTEGPTPTPTVLPLTSRSGLMSPLSIISNSQSYAVVQNASELQDAITAANNATQPFEIFLKAGKFTVPDPRLDIYKSVKIYGLGSEVTILDSATSETLFYVHENGGNLTLKDLTLTGVNSGVAYGGVTVNYGSLTLDSVVIRNNAAVWGGGAIYTYGPTIIRNTIFIDNSAVRGGALWKGSDALNITCTLFDTNQAELYGGALYNVNSNASIAVSSSMFTGNIVPAPPAPYAQGGAIYRSYDSGAVNANGNYWPTWNGATPVATNPNVPNNTNTDTVIYVTITNTRSTNPMDDRSACPDIPPRTTSPTDQEMLADYGVDLAGSWSGAQTTEILSAVRETAIALAVQSSIANPSIADAPRVVFERAMLPSGQRLEITRADMAEEFICKTDLTNIAINCDDNNQTTQYTITHELGHLYNYRAGGQGSGSGSLFDRLDTPGNVKDYNPNVIDRAPVFGYITSPTGAQDWQRGLRGWGSAAATPWSCTGSATNPSDFQQNPCNEPGTGSVEIEEAAADMFLNWVYRKQEEGGFLNCLWEVVGPDLNTCADPGGNDGGLRTGDVRFDWMNTAMDAIFTQRGW